MMTVDEALDFARQLVTAADRKNHDHWAALSALAAEVLTLRGQVTHWHQRATEEAFAKAEAMRGRDRAVEDAKAAAAASNEMICENLSLRSQLAASNVALRDFQHMKGRVVMPKEQP